MASPLALGAGASEGLDTFLNRMLVQQEVDERARHDQATEGLTGRELTQKDDVQQSLEGLRNVQMQGLKDKQAESAKRDANRATFMADPAIPVALKQYVQGTDALPEGDKTIPYELLLPNGGKQEPAGPLVEQPDHTMARVKGDNTSSLVQGPDNQPLKKFNAPPQPDRVLLQSGDSYIPRADALKKIQAGGTVPLATTSSTRTMEEGASMLQPHIAATKAMAEQLDKNGTFGPVMSRIRDIAVKAGSIDQFYELLGADPTIQQDPLAGKFATTLGLLATGAGRVHGGARGGSSPQMYQHFKEMLGSDSSLPLFEGRLSAVDDFMRGYAAGPGQHSEGATPPASDPYTEYLKRNQK